MLCQRIESKWPAKAGGWYHWYGESRPEYIPQSREVPKSIDVRSIIDRQASDCPKSFAERLGVSHESLVALDCKWLNARAAYSFPMSDGNGNHIGIRLRNSAGFKWAVPGSRQGVFLPKSLIYETKIAYLPEGPTDTAALLTIGLFAIGRPTCNSGNDHIKTALKRLGIRRAVIVADNDEIKQTGKRPGLDGAMKLKKELGIPCVIWMPPSPIKDARQFINQGGTKQMIENEVNKKVWSKL